MPQDRFDFYGVNGPYCFRWSKAAVTRSARLTATAGTGERTKEWFSAEPGPSRRGAGGRCNQALLFAEGGSAFCGRRMMVIFRGKPTIALAESRWFAYGVHQ